VVVGLGGFNNIEDHNGARVLTTVIARRFQSSTHSQDTSLVQRDIPLTFGGEVKLLFFVSFVFCHGGIIKDGVSVGAGGISPR